MAGLSNIQSRSPSRHQLGPLARELEAMEFVERLLGKVVLERQSLPVALAPSLLKHLLEAPCVAADLEALGPELFRSPAWLLEASPGQVRWLFHSTASRCLACVCLSSI